MPVFQCVQTENEIDEQYQENSSGYDDKGIFKKGFLHESSLC